MLGETHEDVFDRALRAERAGRFDEARALLRLTVSRENGVPAVEARLRLGRLLILTGSDGHEEAQTALADARTLAETAGSPRLAAAAVHLQALLARYRRRPAEAAALLDQSPVLQLEGTPGPELGQYFHYRGLVELDRGELVAAERLCFRAHQFYQEAGSDQGVAEVCDTLANVLLKRGNSRQALAFARLSLAIKERTGDRFGQAVTLGTVGRAHLLQAHYPEAREAFAQDLEIADELGDPRGAGAVQNSLGETELLMGDTEAACGHFRRGLDSDSDPVNRAQAHLGLARAHLAAGRLDDATSAADELTQDLDGRPEPSALHGALQGVRGALAARRGDAADAERLLREGVEIMRNNAADIHAVPYLYELRDLLQAQGRTPEAVRVMAQALGLLSECGAERGVRDVENWLRTVDAPALLRLALERHFPDILVENILSGQLARQPNRRQEISVLFCDVRGYTALAESMDPEAVIELLNEWFAEATRAVRRHGGMVDKFIGDAVMALFGVPQARESAADDAVRAALSLRDALSAMNMRNRALGGREIRVGVGVHTGDAVVGFVGSHLQQSYTAVGDAVNLASRLQDLTREVGCDILISQATQERQTAAETSFRGKFPIRGRQNQVAVYHAHGLRK